MIRAAKMIWILLAFGVAGTFGLAQSAHAALEENLAALEEFWSNLYPDDIVVNEEPILGPPELLAKAKPDECYNGDYTSDNPAEWVPSTNPPMTNGTCPEGSVPKVNQAYVWSLTKAGNNLWFGTVANTACWVLGSVIGPLWQWANETESSVCEYGWPIFDAFGDSRPPQIYMFDTQTDTLNEKTPEDPLINDTLGIRSAGSHENVIILGGPSLSSGLNLFAFQADGVYIGSTNLPQYNDIRKWIVIHDVLYTSVQNTGGGGSVLRWNGVAENPFEFEVVGNLDAMGANLTEHEGRLFTATWPVMDVTAIYNPDNLVLAGLYMSPPIPKGGLSSLHADAWTKVWDVSEYEPDFIVRYTYGGGALASFNGYLYWGTMHVPVAAQAAALLLQGQEIFGIVFDFDANGDGEIDSDERRAVSRGTRRPTSLFRGSNFGTSRQTVQLLYGLRYLPTYSSSEKSYTIGQDLFHSNRVGGLFGADAQWGVAGFGNRRNAYTWTMAVYGNRLFIGTYDSTSPGRDPEPPFLTGCDLYRVECTGGPAVPENLTGMGNFANYGIRTILADNDNDALYLGMANPRNLLTDGEGNNVGGWELLRAVSTVEPCGGSQSGPGGTGDGVGGDNRTSGDDGDDNGGLHCAIATAAHGSPLEPRVKVLREFRDRFLLPNKVGKAFVRLYNTYSPPIAEFIARHDSVQAVVRGGLLPFIGVSWLVLKLGMGPTLVMVFMLMLSTLACAFMFVSFRKRRPGVN